MSARGPTWAHLAAWCRRNLVDAKRMREDIERHEARDEADAALADLRRIAKEIDAATKAREGWARILELHAMFDKANARHVEAMRRAYP